MLGDLSYTDYFLSQHNQKDAMPLIHRMVLIRVSTNDQVPLELPLVGISLMSSIDL
jgi:hypothetical protein